MKFPLFLPFQPLVAFKFSCIFTSWRMKAVGFCPEGVVQRSHVRQSWKHNLDELFFPIVYGICYRVLWLINSLKFQNNVKRYPHPFIFSLTFPMIPRRFQAVFQWTWYTNYRHIYPTSFPLNHQNLEKCGMNYSENQNFS